MKSKHTALAVAGLCLALTPAFSASGPSWWASYNVLASGQGGDNHSPVNIGQLKHVASRAKAYFDAELPGGAGTAVNGLVNSFGSGPDPENFAPANVGQLKAVASVFYARLGQVFPYAVAGGLIYNGVETDAISSTLPIVPWGDADAAENWRPANIGQLKLVFSFDLGFLASAHAASGDDSDASGDGFAGLVSFFAGFPNDPGIYHSAANAAAWHANPQVEAEMNNPFLTSALYIVLPDQGPFVGSEAAHTVEGTPVNLLSLN